MIFPQKLFDSAWQWFAPSTQPATSVDWQLVERVQSEADVRRGWSDDRLVAEVHHLRQRAAPIVAGAFSHGDQRHATIIPAFVATIEALRRVLGVRLYDVQVLAGLAMTRGAAVEMHTGEGKTLAASLPALAHALSGDGVHVATPNSYLARRDHALLAPVYRLLGVTAGLIDEQVSEAEKRAAYACDITFGTGYEFGFDYLRDQLRLLNGRRPGLASDYRQLIRNSESTSSSRLQRGHATAIIDELDSVLIDEACMPLILAAPNDERPEDSLLYHAARTRALTLALQHHFYLDETAGEVRLTTAGVAAIHHAGATPRGNLQRAWSAYIENALYAHWILRRDVHYVVLGDQVQLIDEFTGRVFAQRCWRDGLHQAVQAKENVSITSVTRAAARISRQRYFRLYRLLCGMTGTLQGTERELRALYRLPTVAIPLRLPCRRTPLPTRAFADDENKLLAVIADVASLHSNGRPVLVGSRTISNSERLAARLDSVGIAYRLLNGKQDEQEAAIVARAGELGAVTIATNMAGRGTDIRLGPGVAERGGLHVIGLERNEAVRIDAQLAGRAGRSGDPGSCQFFVSGDDSLLRRFAPGLSQRLRAARGEVLQDIEAELLAAQCRAESARYSARRSLQAYDRWLNDFLDEI